MKRLHGFEWEDQPWFPHFLRRYMMDFLHFVLNTGNLYQPVTPILLSALEQSGSNRIVDLCSGSGGAIPVMQQNLEAGGKNVPFILTDLYPAFTALSPYNANRSRGIVYHNESVDAAHVPPSLQGFRTLFSAFHHFDAASAKQVLQNAVDSQEGIAIFDGGNRGIGFILLILIFHPIAFFLFTPFIKPFSFGRLLFTYLLPLLPLCTIWDGIMSVLRLYTPGELKKIAEETESRHYQWQSGFVTNKWGIRIAYLTGCPITEAHLDPKH